MFLAELRKFYKLTQEDLANHLCVSKEAVLKWEKGNEVPDIEFLVKLSELYGITVNDIVTLNAANINRQKKICLVQRDKEAKNVFVIGCGRWGTFVSWYLNRIGHDVTLYGRNSSKRMAELMHTGCNSYLSLPDTVELTNDIAKANEADIIVISVGSQNLQKLVIELLTLGINNKTIVLCMKGIEISTGRRLTQIIDDTLDDSNKVAVWVGPGHAQEFHRGVPNCMVIDSSDELVKDYLINNFSSDLIRFYSGNDLIGNEIGAAAKNVIGIAAGMLDGLDMSTLKGELMYRGAKEIGNLIKAMGGNEMTVYSPSHLGDYQSTLFSGFSHNRAFGEAFVRRQMYRNLAEGYYTVKALINMANNHNVELPICEAVYQILYCNQDVKKTMDMLFPRNLK